MTTKMRTANGSSTIRSSAFSPASGWKIAEWLVSSGDEKDALSFPENASGVEEAKAFLNDFDFSNETGLIVQYLVEKCRTQQLESLKWGPTNEGPSGSTVFWLEFSVVEKKPNCESTSGKDVEATLIRVPDTVESIHRITRKGSYQE